MDLDWYATYLTESVANIKQRYEAQLLANQATLSKSENGFLTKRGIYVFSFTLINVHLKRLFRIGC